MFFVKYFFYKQLTCIFILSSLDVYYNHKEEGDISIQCDRRNVLLDSIQCREEGGCSHLNSWPVLACNYYNNFIKLLRHDNPNNASD